MRQTARPGLAVAISVGPAPERRPATNPEAWLKIRMGTARGQPIKRVFHPLTALPPRKGGFRALFFSTFAPYIEGAGSPAMEINYRRNKPFGPGGSTRRLHPSPPTQNRRALAGAKQDRRGR